MSALEKLNQISGYGKRKHTGSHFQIKFRTTADKMPKIVELKKKYPEMLVHKTLKEAIIFGGTFPSQSQFLFDVQCLIGIKTNFNA